MTGVCSRVRPVALVVSMRQLPAPATPPSAISAQRLANWPEASRLEFRQRGRIIFQNRVQDLNNGHATQQIFCTTRRELLSEYGKNVHEYSGLVRQLGERIPRSNREYLEVVDRAETARKQTERARLEYENHLREHGCSPVLPDSRSSIS